MSDTNEIRVQNQNEKVESPATTHQFTRDVEAMQALLSNQYRVIKSLGKGSQGSVFLAESCADHREVAIKQLLIQSVKDWKAYDLFHREAEVLKCLNIPGVAKVYETIESLDSEVPMALIVQDYIAGEPLQKFIANGHRFQIGQIGAILLQLLDVLQQLHQGDPQVIHRDIKPSNIILNYKDNSMTPEVHLIDFGAVSNPQVKGGGSTVVGTYGYMAPEQLMGRASAASDIYSLAIVAVYLLSGVAPENLEIQDYHVLIDSHLEHLPHQITAFLRKMLEPRLEDRMADYNQIRSFFTALKKQKFDDIPRIQAIRAQKQYSLSEVYSYHQTGNIVLWQELEDSTPRRLPSRYKAKRIIDLLTSDGEHDSKIFKDFSTSLKISLILVAASIFVYCCFHSYFLLIVLGGFAFYSCLATISFFIERYKVKMFPYKFLKHARKSMATVIRVKYISQYKSESKTRLNHSYKACWRITYSFNPPDDASPDDIIHAVGTHIKPEVKEGDLLPILYLIQKNELNGETVYSSPYPLPMGDVLRPFMTDSISTD